MINKKKICIILPTHYAAFMGGAQYQAKCILDGLLASHQYEIYYLARRVNPDFKPDGYEIIKISDDGGLRRLGFFVDSFKLYNLLKKIKPDVIYQRIACAYTGISAYYAKHSGCKLIWHVAHVNDVTPGKHTISLNPISEYIDKRYVEYGLRNATYIVAQTEEQSELLHMHYGRYADKVIPNLHPEPTEIIDKTDPVTVVWIANFKPWKQPEAFIRLARDLRHIQNTRFIMIGAMQGGDREWRDTLLKEIDGLDNLEYLGRKEQDEINALLARSHIFVNTSLHEGFANTFIQAWMREVPVISLHVNPDNIFDRYDVGYYSGSYNEMRSQVESLILDTDKRTESGSNAKNYAFEHHSLQNIQHLMRLMES